MKNLKTYKEAIEYLESCIPPPTTVLKPIQLERPRYLCKLLGDPQTKYPIIHVGGTSGKGSTSTFAATILKELGLKTGLHTSPHLESMMERFQINNKPMSETEFVHVLNEIMPSIDTVHEEKTYGTLTYFEIITVLAFYYFAKKKVDVAVVEVGLGGRLDVTNVAPPSTVILTNVSLDHTQILGKTVTKIAQDKMGIIKSGAPAVVSGFTQSILRHAIIKKCTELNVPLYLVSRDFDWDTRNLSLVGDFQHQNFTLAKEAVRYFCQIYFPNLKNKLPEALKHAAVSAFIPGRLEIVSKDPLIILDGAHNNAKMTALIISLKHLYPKQKWVVVMAVKKGKSYASMIKFLEKITEQFVFTSFTHIDTQEQTSISPEELARKTKKSYAIEPNPIAAVEMAQNLTKTNKLPLLVTGSLYLVGRIRPLFHK